MLYIVPTYIVFLLVAHACIPFFTRAHVVMTTYRHQPRHAVYVDPASLVRDESLDTTLSRKCTAQSGGRHRRRMKKSNND